MCKACDGPAVVWNGGLAEYVAVRWHVRSGGCGEGFGGCEWGGYIFKRGSAGDAGLHLPQTEGAARGS